MRRRPLNTAHTAAQHDAEHAAVQLELHLRAGGALVAVPAPGLALDAGETAYADVVCTSARYYPVEVVYPQAPAGYFEDHPTFGRRWVSNDRLADRRRHEAEREAQARWRDQAQSRVVLTSNGLRISPAGAPTWQPFDHALLTSVRLTGHGLVLSYSVCAPLLLSGPAAPWLSAAIRYLAPAIPAFWDTGI